LLKQYITKAYDADQVNTQLDIAGNSYYQKAANDWSSLRSLIEAGNKFIAANADTLAGNNDDNMPPDFPKTFQTDSDTALQPLKLFLKPTLPKRKQQKIRKMLTWLFTRKQSPC
jgi:hypothetical protein